MSLCMSGRTLSRVWSTLRTCHRRQFHLEASQTHRRMMPRDDDDDGDEFEHGDLEVHAMDANTADD